MKDRLMEPVGLRERTACLFCMSQSLFENSFPPSARPTSRYIWPDSVSVARYASIIGTKSPTKWDAQPTESNFQTRSRACLG